MKKLLALSALALSSAAFAASTTVEYVDISGTGKTPADQNQWSISVKEELSKGLVGDVGISQTNNKNGGSSDTLASTRTEAGLTGITAAGPLNFYVRGGVGQKFTSSTNTSYYSVEPGVAVPLGSGLTAKVGYRFRNAFDSNVADQTRTVRAGISYDVTKKDTIGVRYDRMRGDTEQNIVAVNYTRSF